MKIKLYNLRIFKLSSEFNIPNIEKLFKCLLKSSDFKLK